MADNGTDSCDDTFIGTLLGVEVFGPPMVPGPNLPGFVAKAAAIIRKHKLTSHPVRSVRVTADDVVSVEHYQIAEVTDGPR